MNGLSNELEDQIPMLHELDKLRVKSAKLRDEGLDALQGWTDDKLQGWLDDKDKEESPSKTNKTAAIAIIVKAFCERSKEPPEKLIEYLKDLKLNAIVESPHSVLDAALVMQALLAVPDCAYTKPVFLCLYWIVRELYSVDYPDYGIGGARASPSSGLVSAFTTSECVNAILDFGRVHRNTASFFKQVDEFNTANDQLNNMPPSLEHWSEAERDRLVLTFQTTQRSLSGNLAFRLDKFLDDKKETDAYDDKKETDAYLKNLASQAATVIENTKKALEEAQSEIKGYRETEKGKILETEVSHLFALDKVLKDVGANGLPT